LNDSIDEQEALIGVPDQGAGRQQA
jgi:hypothetical protein